VRLHESVGCRLARGKPLSRWGFAYLLKQHAEAAGQRCPQLLNKQVSPHVLRHTSAMIVLHATRISARCPCGSDTATWRLPKSTHAVIPIMPEQLAKTDPFEQIKEAIAAPPTTMTI
jgi:integrase